MKDYLVVVDLSSGKNLPKVKKIDIPTGELKRFGDNPQFIDVIGVKAISENSVRLYIPESKYGVGSIDVKLPAFSTP